MKNWIDVKDNHEPRVDEVGGKGFNLLKLSSNGINVPSFGVVTSHAHSYWLKNKALPEELVKDIKKSIETWSDSGQYFAVRSSMADEDGDTNSFAGILESFLYVSADKIEENIIKCFQSVNSDRAREYALKANINPEKMKSSVVVQVMINSTRSGVAFSRSPVGDSSLTLIESCYGIGEGLVSGLVDVDSYLVDRFKNTIKATISKKETGMFLDLETKELHEKVIPSEDQERSSLNEDELTLLMDQIQCIEDFYGHPVDIEWAYHEKNNNCVILQTRPITQSFKSLEYYVDTNLSESYPGLTSPFTGSVIPKLYESVFLDSARILGASKGRLLELSKFYEKLVCFIDGHLYYHLDSYYQALMALPGGEKNVESWHRMIGGKLDHVTCKRKIKKRTFIEDIVTILNLSKIALFNDSIFKKFYQDSTKHLKVYEHSISKSQNTADLSVILKELMRAEFNFGLTVVNDILIMIFLSIFERLALKSGIDKRDIANFLRTDSDVESVKPIEELEKFIKSLSSKERFLNTFQELLNTEEQIEYEELMIAFNKRGLKEDYQAMTRYLDKYGDRSFEELKFECLTFSQSPRNFYDFISWYSSSEGLINKSESKSYEPSGILLKWVWRKLHKYIAARERSRLERSRFYNLLRESFLSYIKELRKSEKFKSIKTNEFFGLTINEICDHGEGKITDAEILDLIETRRDWSTKNYDFPEFLAYDFNEKPWFSTINFDSQMSTCDGVLRGEAASPFSCEGEALVLKSPQEAFKVNDLSNKILITKTTDPAWVFIMSKCLGLVSEKGSLLSHTAIIGRELSLPTIVGVKSATKLLKTGQKIKLNAVSGEIELI